MKVQFLGKGNKILYCDDEVIRVTKEKTFFKTEESKEKKVWDFGKVEISVGSCIVFYDHTGKLWDEVHFNKEYLEKAEKIARKIKVESNKYIESFKDEDFLNNEKLIPTINELLDSRVKDESEFIDTIYTLTPKIFGGINHPIKIVFKKDDAWSYMSFGKVADFAEVLYNVIHGIFLETGYVFKDDEDLEVQCYKDNGEELISFSSMTKEIVERMRERGELSE